MAVDHPITSWKQRTIIRILLIIAEMLAEDPRSEKQIKDLANGISCGIS